MKASISKKIKPYKEKKDKSYDILISMLKKQGKVSFISLSEKLGKDFEEIKDFIAVIDKEKRIKIIYPAVGAPYITL
ncbi:MAG: hypothetical protein PHN56_00275 [Candidatus Nanoarchaeia archaeon]|nr:hypothetical protein [Candidatus Nanoarchaeia archaeon]